MTSSPTDSERRADWRYAVIALDQRCIAASPESPCDGDLQAHHVIYQKHLRNEGLDGLAWDPCMGAAVCERHHRRHHAGYEPIPVNRLPGRCIQVIEEFDLVLYLERFYAGSVT
jgi:hypothetical protein